MRTTEKQTIFCLKVVIYLLWPTCAWATGVTLGETLATVPALAWTMVFMLSTISGLAALLNRLKDDTPKKLRLFVTSHMLGSALAGLLIFFMSTGAGVADFYQAGLIATAAYAGAKFLDAAADRLVTKIKEAE